MGSGTGEGVAPLTSDLRELNIESRPGRVGIGWDRGLGCSASGEVGAEAVVRHCWVVEDVLKGSPWRPYDWEGGPVHVLS